MVENSWYLMHVCTDEEFDKFYAPDNKQTAAKVSQMQENGEFYCLDESQYKNELIGTWTQGTSYRGIDVGVFACGT